jgi:hypothetical protein
MPFRNVYMTQSNLDVKVFSSLCRDTVIFQVRNRPLYEDAAQPKIVLNYELSFVKKLDLGNCQDLTSHCH